MKFVFFDNSLWSLFHFRGIIIKTLISKGHEVVLVAPYEQINDKKYIEGVRIIYIKLQRTKTNPLLDLVYFSRIISILAHEKPDVVFLYTIKPVLYGSIASRLFNIYSVSMLAGTGDLFSNRSYKHKIASKFVMFSFLMTSKLILLNKEDESYILSNKMISPDKVITLSCGEGVDINKYAPSLNYIPNKSKVFVMMGRLLYEKGYLEYVEVAKLIKKEFPDSKFLLLGFHDSSHPSSIPMEIIKENMDNGFVEYLGTIDNIQSVFDYCDCFVLPSYYNEGMNRSLMEAIAMGMPVITSNNKGCREMVIHEKNGFIVAPKDISSLYSSVRKICVMSDDNLLDMRKYSRKIAEDMFSDQIVLNEYMKIIRI